MAENVTHKDTDDGGRSEEEPSGSPRTEHRDRRERKRRGESLDQGVRGPVTGLIQSSSWWFSVSPISGSGHGWVHSSESGSSQAGHQ